MQKEAAEFLAGCIQSMLCLLVTPGSYTTLSTHWGLTGSVSFPALSGSSAVALCPAAMAVTWGQPLWHSGDRMLSHWHTSLAAA